MTGIAALPVSAGARTRSASFRAIAWVLTTGGSGAPSPTASPHIQRVKPGKTVTLCSMSRLDELAIDYSFTNTTGNVMGKHGLLTPYTFVISGPGGKQSIPFTTAHHNGRGTTGFGYNALPGNSTPAAAGRYTVTIRKGAHRLMRALIVLKSSGTCGP